MFGKTFLELVSCCPGAASFFIAFSRAVVNWGPVGGGYHSGQSIERRRVTRPNAVVRDGVGIHVARRHKERTHPELVGPRARVRLVVWVGEVGGWWSGETLTCLRL